jgi:hypothetical protein
VRPFKVPPERKINKYMTELNIVSVLFMQFVVTARDIQNAKMQTEHV